MQNPLWHINQQFFSSTHTRKPSKHSGANTPTMLNQVYRSLLTFLDLALSVMSKLTSQNKKNISLLLISVVMILGSLKIKFGYGGKELHIALKIFF